MLSARGIGIIILLAAAIVLLGAAATQAAVSITGATNGTTISADTAQNSTAPSFNTLSNIVILEVANGDFAAGANTTLILTAPTGWRFNAGVGSASAARISGGGALEISVGNIAVTASSITVTFTVSGTGQINSLTISGIQAQPTNGATLPSAGNIYRATSNPGTASVNGITTTSSADGSGGSNFGSLAQVAGAVARLVFSTQPGSATAGAVFGVQPAVRTQDQFGNNSTSGLGATRNVAVSLTSGTGPLQGTTTLNIGTAGGNGTVSYTNLRIDAAGTGKQLTATSAGLTSALSSTFSVSAASATQLGFAQPPTNTTAGTTIAPPVTVQVQDAFGNSIPVQGVSVDISLSSGTGVLNGTVTQTTDVGGLATFNDLSIQLTGAKKLTAASSGFVSVESGTFTILAAAPSQLIYIQQPTAATAGAAIAPAVTVHVADSFGNNVPGAMVTMTLNGTGTLGGTTTQSTDGSGVATFANLNVNLVGSKTLTAACGLATPVGSDPFVISPAGASRVAFVQQPSNATAGTVIAPPITVRLQDAFGNNVASSGVSITMALTTGTGALSGTTSQTTDGTGLATFNNLSINLSGSKNLTASSVGLSSAQSAAFTISPATATQLAFAQQPSATMAGVAISPAVQVRVSDNFGNGVPGVLVLIDLSSGTGTLGGTLNTPSDSAGLATFNDLNIDLTGPKQLISFGPFLTPVESSSFNILPAAPSRLVIETQPSATATAGIAFGQQPVLRIEDQFGNLVTTDNTTVITAARAAGSGTLQGTVTATAVAGMVTFTTLAHNAAGTISLQFTSGSLTDATSDPIAVSAGPFSKLQVLVPGETANPGSPSGKTGAPVVQTASVPFNATVNAVDAYWNLIDTVTDTVSLSSTDPNALLPANAALAAGTQTFSIVLKTAGSATVTATDLTDGGKTPGTSAAIPVSAGAFTKLQILLPGETAAPGTATGKTGTPTTQAAGAAFTATVNAVDADWNLVSTATDTVGFTSSDSNATLPANAALVAGTRNSSVTLRTAGSQTVTAADITDGNKSADTSAPVTVTAAPPNKLAIQTQPLSATAGVVFGTQPVIRVEDAFGNLMSGDNGRVITAARGTGTGPLQGTLTATTVNGIATFSNLSYDIAETITITFANAALTGTNSANIVVGPGTATRLVFTTQPGGVSRTGSPLATQPVVRAQDALGNNSGVGLPANLNLTLTLTSGSGSLLGTTNLNIGTAAGNGTATFANVQCTSPGANKQLTAAASGLTSAVSTNFFVGGVELATGGSAISADTTGGAYTTLTGPIYYEAATGDAGAGTIILNAPSGFVFDTGGTAPTVLITRLSGSGANGNNINNVASGTAAAITSRTTTAITFTVSAVSENGVTCSLTWQNIRVRPAAGTPLASGNILKTGTSPMAAVTGTTSFGTLTEVAGAARRLGIQTQPSPAVTAGLPFPQSPVVRIEDQFGNLVNSDNTSLVTASRNAGAGTLQGLTTSGAVNGIVSFGPIFHTVANTITIGFASGTLTNVTSSNVVVSAGPAFRLAIQTQPPAAATVTAPFAPQPAINIEDQFGNRVTSDNSTVVTATRGAGTGNLLGTLSATAASGLASFSNLAHDTVETITIGFSAPGLPGVTSSNVVVGKGNTTTTLASSANPSVFGQSVTFTATVNSVTTGATNRTGTVQFRIDGVDFGTPVAVSANSATSAPIASLSVAGHTVTAVYSGDANFNGSTSANLAQTVNRANTATAVASSANPSCLGQSVFFTATVNAVAPGSGLPTGTLQFRTNGVNFGAAVTLTNGIATSGATATLPVGNHTITAVYTATAGSNYNGSTSPNFTQTVSAPPTCSITGSNSVCANVTGNLFTAPAGMISYSWSITGNGTIAGATNGQSVSVDPTSGGSFTLTLSTINANGCISTCNKPVTVNMPPAITAQPSSRTNCAGSAATFSVTATGGSLTYQWRRNGTNLLNGGSVSGATTATLTLSPVALADLGSYDVVVSGACPPSVTSSMATFTVIPSPDATLTTASEACENSTGNVASVPDAGPGATYSWTLVGGTITSGQGTRSIVFIATTTGSLTVGVAVTNSFGCTATTNRTLPISKSHADLQAWKTLPTTLWNDSGTMNSGDHSYNEGNPLPFRLVLVCAPATWSFTFQYDFVDNNSPVHFIDFLTTFNTPDCRTTPVSTRECDNQTCIGVPTYFPIPTDPSLPPGAQVPGNFTVYNGTITNVGTYSTILAAGTVSKRVTISGTSAGTAPNVLILFGGHLAAEQDWGIGNGASQFPGSSAKMAVLSFSGGGNDDTASINPLGVSRTFLTLGDATAVVEGNSGTTTATLNLTLSTPSTFPVSVDWVTTNGTATLADNDYQGTNGTVYFAPGETNKTINVLINGDTKFEPNENFTVVLTDRCSAGVAKGTGLITIINDDGVPTLSIDDVTVTEGNSGTTNAVFTLSLSNPSAQTIAVNYATANGTATLADNDYQSASGTVTFAPGQTNRTLTVLVNGDIKFEFAETFQVNLSGATNATIADSQGIGTINNDDGVPSITINDVTVAEGNSGTVNAVFTVSLSAPSSQTVTVTYGTADGTATLADNDYQTTTGIVTFAPGQTNQTVTVLVNGDSKFEPNETFQINLSNATNSTIADNQGIGTINNDDLLPSITINDVTVTEGNSGTVNAVFTVSLSNPSSQTITVNYVAADGTAMLVDNDYQNATGTVTFAPGQTNQTLTVLVNGDTKLETNETFHVNLSGASNGTIADNQANGTIVNDDSQPTITINDVTVMELDSLTTNAVFTVSLSNPSSQTISVNYITADGTATTDDYQSAIGTVTFAPGETNHTITVVVKADTIDEPSETFFVDLSVPVNATIADNQGLGTILDNDSPPSLAINSISVTEGNSGTTLAISTVTLSSPSDFAVTVEWATADGSATVADNDYATASGTLTFLPGVTTQTITNAVNGDILDEGNEAFFVNLSAATNATISDPQGVVTILNDDGAPTVGVNDVSVTEGNSGLTPVVSTVSLTVASARTLTVRWATADGTATVADNDYVPASGTLSFAPGVTSLTVTNYVTGDTVNEPNESFLVKLSAFFSFNGSSGDEPTFSVDGQPVNANLGNMSRGSGLDPLPASGAFNARSWTTASGPYYSFNIMPNVGSPSTLTGLEFDALRTATGPGNLALRSSLDGFTADLATFALPAPDTLVHFAATLGAPFSGLTAPVEFRIYASGATDANGALQLDNVELFGDFNQGIVAILNDDCIAPSITQQPSAATNCVGGPVTFSVSATGLEPLSYQWRLDGGDIAGATNSSYTIPSVTAADAGNYSVVVDNVCGFDISIAVALVVNLPTTASDPGDLVRCAGENAVFTTSASGTGPFMYQWSKDGVDIIGATADTLDLGPVTAANAGLYCVVVSGTCNSVTNCATLTVNALTTANGPSNLVLCPEQGASFSTVALGTGPHSYQWRKDGVDISGETGPTYSIASVSVADAGAYCVVVNGACNSVTNCATLTVNTPTTASGPSDLVRCLGQAASLSVVASGTGPFSYQWSKDGVDINGATNADHSIASVGPGDAGNYCVVVTGACNSLTNCAALMVTTPTTATGPTDLVRCPGQSAAFGTTASGTGPFTYQWRKDGVDITGATDPSLTIPFVSGADDGVYCVVVSGACNAVTNCAALTVSVPTTATGPSAVNVTLGQGAMFATTASGTGPFNYQWSKDGVDINGATDPSLAIASATATDAGIYCVVVTGSCNSVTNCAALAVCTPPSAMGPADAAVCQGADASFTASASGSGPFGYEWSLDGNAVGTNGPALTVPTGALTPGAHAIAVVVTGLCGSVTNSATLTVNPLTTASGPANVTVCPGVDATFTTTAGGTGPFDYQWTLDGNPAGTNGPVLTVSTVSLSLGDHLVTVTVTGLCGSVTNIATLTVGEAEPPMVVCPANVVTNTAPGLCSQVVSYAPMASDNCPGVTVSCNPASGSSFNTGTTPVTCTAADPAGNTNSCTFNVTVNDTEPPMIVCPANVVTNTALGLCTQVVGYAPLATDNCAGVTVSCNPASGASFATGTTPVTCTATDAAGNTNSCTFTVTVNDTEPPTVACPANVVTNTASGLCTQVVDYAPMTSDNCAGVVTVSCNPASGTSFATGTTPVTCTATDTTGNSNSCTFTVTVNEAEPPVIVCPANILTNTAPGLCSQVVGYAPMATDNCPGVTVSCNPPTGSSFGTGTTPVTCAATDAAGNTNTCTFNVTVNDTEPPVVVCPANVTTNTAPGLCAQVVVYAPMATDNCAGVTVGCNPASGASFATGTTPVTCTATDAAGNTNSCTFTVTVNDTEPPTVACPANVVTNTASGLCTQVVDYAPTSSDNCPGAVTVSCNPPSGSSFATGTTPVSCLATDTTGNSNSCTFTVTVNEAEPPVIVCPANILTNTAPGLCSQVVGYAPMATDNCPGVTVSCNPPAGSSFGTGTTLVTCTATDAAGNTNTCTFTVTVNDTEPPVVVCPANMTTNTAPGLCAQVVVYAPMATDNCAGVTIACNPASGASFATGTTPVTCTATDAAGNTNSCTFTVTVNDTEPPTVACPANVVTNTASGLCTQVVDYAPTSSDNCPGAVTVSCNPPSGSSFATGTTPVSCLATDTTGNSNSCTFTVTVNEAEPPVIVCPANILTNTAPGLCSQVVGYAPMATDNCPGVTVSCNPPAGSSFGTGTTLVTCTATDAAGNTNTCTFNVTVNDTEPPVVVCPANMTTNTAPGLCAQVVVYAPMATDNCAGVTVACNPASGATFGTGTTPVTCTATDAAGNTNSCTFTVTVNDTEPPTVACPANVVTNTASGLCTQVVDYAPTSSDNCPGAVTVSCNPPSGSSFTTGTTPVTCTATDTAGNSNSCAFTVTVSETEPPLVVCPANIVTNAAPSLCTQVVSYTPMASDNCPGLTVSCNPASGSSFGTGATPVTCTATDAAGNTSSCTFNVSVNDAEPPMIACPANVVTNTALGLCTQVISYAPIATDNCAGVTVACNPSTGSTFGTGTTPVTCTATDAAGNTNSCTFIVTVNDAEPPSVACPANVVTNTASGLCTQVVDYAPTSSDNCPGAVTVNCNPPSGSSFVTGTTPVTCTATDTAGNTNNCTFTVTVIETEPPVVVCPANVVTNTAPGQCSQVVGYAPMASDNCPGVTVSCNPASGSSFGTGTTPVTCTATDAAGNTSSCTFNVTVNETEPPMIVCPANVVTNTALGLCTQVVGYAPMASDNCPGVTVSCNPASGSSFGAGTTPVTCTATDAAGNTNICTFTVTVNDTEPPSVACPANVVTNTASGLCTQVVDYAPTSSDNCPGAVTVSCNPPSGSSFATGTTPVTCTATDTAGNSNSCTFTVTVIETEPPVIICPANIVTNAAAGLCSQLVNYTPMATDNCPGVTVSCNPASGSSFGTGTTPVTCTATDAAGNTSSCTFNVTVNETEPPMIVCPANVVTNTALGLCTQVVGYAPMATDNCAGVTVSCNPASGSSFGAGTTPVTCTATDAAGNTNSCTFTVTVNDAEPPVIVCPANVVTNTASGLCTQVVDYALTSSDNCPGAVTVSCNPPSGSSFVTGTTPVTCTATDAAGNSNSCTFTVTVNEAEPPVVVCPANVVTNTAPGLCSQVVNYAPMASDNCPGVTVSCNPASGSSFGTGTTPVTCTATDAAGNTSSCTFNVTVNETEPPVIVCPANVVTNTALGLCTQVISYAPMASDNCPGVTVSCNPPTGTSFGPGVTPVTCAATDAAGNTSSCTFIVTVNETEPPVLVCPANVVTNAALGQPTQVVTYAPTANDNCPGVTVSCNPPSGSTFPAGTTPVTCTAMDATGNSNSCMFTVTVTVVTSQFGLFAGPKVFNPQTGLFEQQVIVTNTGFATVAAVRLCVGGLRTGIQLHNAVGTDAGLPYVQCNAPVNPGQTVTMRLEFYVPDRRSFTNTLEAKVALPTAATPSLAGGVLIDRAFVDSRLAGETRYVLEFTTIPGRIYTVIYSDDMNTWKAATPSITATANRTQWYDDGPPKTDSKPISNSSRYYRVILAPVNP